MNKPAPLTEAQLAEARKALQTAAQADDKVITDQILFEGKRDELAYKLISEGHQQDPKVHLSFGDAQKLATAQLEKLAEAEKSAPGSSPEAAAVTTPAAPSEAPAPESETSTASAEPEASTGRKARRNDTAV
ncbi:hypothetical protein BH09VER1_BH09VER1_24570 [soil metagenome]